MLFKKILAGCQIFVRQKNINLSLKEAVHVDHKSTYQFQYRPGVRDPGILQETDRPADRLSRLIFLFQDRH